MACGPQSRVYLAKYSDFGKAESRSNSDVRQLRSAHSRIFRGADSALPPSFAAVMPISLILHAQIRQLSYKIRGLIADLPIFPDMTIKLPLSFYAISLCRVAGAAEPIQPPIRAPEFAHEQPWVGMTGRRHLACFRFMSSKLAGVQ